MPAEESFNINPYAPSSTLDYDAPSTGEFPENGIQFSGVIDLPAVKHTRRGSLVVGLTLGLAFIGLLLTAAVGMGGGGAFVVTGLGAGLTGLALWGFIGGQTDRPLLKFDWMQGVTQGTLHRHRLDVSWDDGQSRASLLFPATPTDMDFANSRGRLFVARGLPCFIPRAATSPEDWGQVRRLHFRRDQSERGDLLPSPASGHDSAIRWPPADHIFAADRQKHEFVCRDPIWSRNGFLFSAIILVLLILMHWSSPGSSNGGILVFTMLTIGSAIFWLSAEWRRRDWLQPKLTFHPARPSEAPPSYERWIDEGQVLVGYHDAWLCIPWSAVQKATISSFAIELSVTPLLLDHWFLERGRFTDQQWSDIIRHVRSRVIKVDVWGAARRLLDSR